MSENSAAVATTDDVDAPIANISSGVADLGVNDVIYSGPLNTFDEKLDLLNKITTSSKLSDFISKHAGESFDLYNYAVQRVDLVDENTGETNSAPRVFLVGKTLKGEDITLSTISRGVLNSIGQIGALLGAPSEWPSALRVRPTQIEGPKGRIFTLVPMAS